jgi:hypothetical protein
LGGFVISKQFRGRTANHFSLGGHLLLVAGLTGRFDASQGRNSDRLTVMIEHDSIGALHAFQRLIHGINIGGFADFEFPTARKVGYGVFASAKANQRQAAEIVGSRVDRSAFDGGGKITMGGREIAAIEGMNATPVKLRKHHFIRMKGYLAQHQAKPQRHCNLPAHIDCSKNRRCLASSVLKMHSA